MNFPTGRECDPITIFRIEFANAGRIRQARETRALPRSYRDPPLRFAQIIFVDLESDKAR
jgi:hypothetical protein